MHLLHRNTGQRSGHALSRDMISVVIETRNDEDGLARTLASLVPGAVEGIVREVIVCDLGSSDQTHRVADHAGCHFLPSGGVPAGIRHARSEWLLIVEPGARMMDGWIGAVRDHLATSVEAARFSAVANGGSSFLARLFSARRPLSQGLLIPRRQALGLCRPGAGAAALAGAIKARRIGGAILSAPARPR